MCHGIHGMYAKAIYALLAHLCRKTSFARFWRIFVANMIYALCPESFRARYSADRKVLTFCVPGVPARKKMTINPIQGGGKHNVPPLSCIGVYARVYAYTRNNFFLTIPHFD